MEPVTYFRFMIVLVFVLALIGLLAWLVRRFGPNRRSFRTGGARRRLQMVEMAPVDSKHRLVLVRRDGTEHLLLLGVNSDLVIETGIPASPAAEPVSNPVRDEETAP